MTDAHGPSAPLASLVRGGEPSTIRIGTSIEVGPGRSPVLLASVGVDAVRCCMEAAPHVGIEGVVIEALRSPGSDGVADTERSGLEHDLRDRGLAVLRELVSTHEVDSAVEAVDGVVIPSTAMHHYPLLRSVGRTSLPTLLHRSKSAMLDEWLLAAEYILCEGNRNVVLCEGGVRSIEGPTRDVLDLASVPVLHARSHLPVTVRLGPSVADARSRTSMILASVAVGASGILLSGVDWSDREATLEVGQAVREAMQLAHPLKAMP